MKTEADYFLRQNILKKLRIVIRAAQQHSQWIEKQCGVSGAQLWIMKELHESTGLRVGALATKLAIHQTTTSNLLDDLEKRGFIERVRDPKDKRAVIVTLTAKGLTIISTAPKPAKGLLPEALTQMQDQDLLQLDSGLQQLIESIGVLDEEYGMLPLPFTM